MRLRPQFYQYPKPVDDISSETRMFRRWLKATGGEHKQRTPKGIFIRRAASVHTSSRLFDGLDVGAHPREMLARGITFPGAWPVVADVFANIWNANCAAFYQQVVPRPGSVAINDEVVSKRRVGKATIPYVSGLVSPDVGAVIGASG